MRDLDSPKQDEAERTPKKKLRKSRTYDLDSPDALEDPARTHSSKRGKINHELYGYTSGRACGSWSAAQGVEPPPAPH